MVPRHISASQIDFWQYLRVPVVTAAPSFDSCARSSTCFVFGESTCRRISTAAQASVEGAEDVEGAMDGHVLTQLTSPHVDDKPPARGFT